MTSRLVLTTAASITASLCLVEVGCSGQNSVPTSPPSAAGPQSQAIAVQSSSTTRNLGGAANPSAHDMSYLAILPHAAPPPPADTLTPIRGDAGGRQFRMDPMPRLFKGDGNSRQAKSVVTNDDMGGGAGTDINTNYGDLGVYSNMTAYGMPGYPAVNLDAATDGKPNYLYAPTERPAGYGCFEIVTEYTRGGVSSPTYAGVTVYNWCANNDSGAPTESFLPFDSNFASTYVRNYGDGLPEYTVEVLRRIDGLWHALIYNHIQNGYEELVTPVSGAASVQQGRGWDFFETHYYAQSYCNTQPTISATGIRRIDGGHSLHLVDGNDGGSIQYFNAQQCFTVDAYHNNPQYQLNWVTQYNQWTVRSLY